MGRTSKSLPSISLALTSYSDSRVRNVSLKRITSDQFSLLQTGSMDVSGDQEQDRIHLRDLLTCSARSLVSPVRASESGGVSRSRKYPKEGLGTSFHCNSETRHSKNFASLPQAYPSTPEPSSASPTAHGMQKPTLSSSEPPQRSRLRRRASFPERRRFNPPDLNMLRPAFSLKMSGRDDPTFGRGTVRLAGITDEIRP
jgi:hypothetical protein